MTHDLRVPRTSRAINSLRLATLQKTPTATHASRLAAARAGATLGRLERVACALVSLGLDLPQNPDSVVRGTGLIAIRLHDGRAELWASDEAEQVRSRLSAQLKEAALDRWLLDQIRAGIGQVFASTRDLFIPQMINLQALGGVSFKKGCYTGQEIVARMQYLGKLKRRLYRLATRGEPDELPAPGIELFSPVHGSSVGEVVLAATSTDKIELLAVVQEDAVADGRLYLGSPDGLPLELLELPYNLDPDREIQR